MGKHASVRRVGLTVNGDSIVVALGPERAAPVPDCWFATLTLDFAEVEPLYSALLTRLEPDWLVPIDEWLALLGGGPQP